MILTDCPHSPGLGLEQQPETSNNCGSHHQSHLDTNVLALAGFGEQLLQWRNETMYKRTGRVDTCVGINDDYSLTVVPS